MKTTKLLAVVLLFISSLLISCSPDLDYVSSTNEIVTRGSWRVDYFFDTQNKTGLFDDYSFQFTGNGEVLCTSNTDNFTGKWNVIRDVNGDDVLNIRMDEQTSLSEVNRSWTVTSKSLSNLKMLSSSQGELRISKD